MRYDISSDFGAYTYVAATRTLTITGCPVGLTAQNILSIINVTRGQLVYSPSILNGTVITATGDGATVVFGTDVSAASHANSDVFLINVSIAPGRMATQTAVPAVSPVLTSSGNASASTNATGSSFTVFGAQACRQVAIINQSGVVIEVQQGGSGIAIPVPSGTVLPLFGLTNLNQLGIRRVDQQNTVVTVHARWEA